MIRIQYEIISKKDGSVIELFIEPLIFETIKDAENYIRNADEWVKNPKIVDVTTKILKEFN